MRHGVFRGCFYKTANIKGKDVEVKVRYEIYGRYSPGDRNGPPEYPEVNILSIKDKQGNSYIGVLDEEALSQECLEDADECIETAYEEAMDCKRRKMERSYK